MFSECIATLIDSRLELLAAGGLMESLKLSNQWVEQRSGGVAK